MSGSDKKRIPPLSIRLTAEEREQLEIAAGGMTIAAYVRLKLFSETEPRANRKTYTRKQTSPSSELAMVGHMLGGLGSSEISNNLEKLAEAAEIGALPVTPETEDAIQSACETVQEIRVLLISALGVKPR